MHVITSRVSSLYSGWPTSSKEAPLLPWLLLFSFVFFFFFRLPEGSSKISWSTLVSNLHRQRWPWTADCLGIWDELWRTPYLAQSFNSSPTCKWYGFQSIPQKFLWNCKIQKFTCKCLTQHIHSNLRLFPFSNVML